MVLQEENTEASTDIIVQDLEKGTESEPGRDPAQEKEPIDQETGTDDAQNRPHEVHRQC